MNKRQLEAAKKVIDGDATGWGSLIEVEIESGEVLYCALGGLGKAAGLTDKQLRREDERQADNEGETLRYPLIQKRLREVFGIDKQWLEQIVHKNDGASSVPARRRSLKLLMDKIYAAGQKKAAV